VFVLTNYLVTLAYNLNRYNNQTVKNVAAGAAAEKFAADDPNWYQIT
jgi:glutathione synthase/RimK-type ligase-like ATP-grasp enzyme